ncbi:MAG: hypothetical protein ACTHWW_04650 [Arthrobacter sp.]|uniref:hypothetical protein n=1 Tax=unclassified Arthrobacter TaxID=235627 RepID=UPI0026517A16|nr:hypothetical protein [Micrococcaceae bacterium]MDN5813104.1 hypothetical protein [Micrococcaceae bacterium]MDN5824514.1 hypothetical protein [Micrococcaceae bacterium]MDN5878502.1 hypothetical protein [Micrococcaceae bacterium]MDN5885442.1 hypothetical protein [Micrococcaceae bacterium]
MPSAQDPLPFHRTAMLPLLLAMVAIALALVSTFLAALVAKLVLLGLAMLFVVGCGVSLGILFARVRKEAAKQPRD